MSEAMAASDQPGGLRERKRRETHDRLVRTGLELFVENGFEATTLDAIAAAAGISRRTFFYYFKSKEDVLLAQEGSGFSQALRAAILEEATDQTPHRGGSPMPSQARGKVRDTGIDHRRSIAAVDRSVAGPQGSAVRRHGTDTA